MDHGPSILSLSGEQKKWLSQVHHRLGHPDAETLSRYLKTTEAEPALIDGARDYQCDACSETRRGYDLPKVGGIHENLGFNHTLGMDGATQKENRFLSPTSLTKEPSSRLLGLVEVTHNPNGTFSKISGLHGLDPLLLSVWTQQKST